MNENFAETLRFWARWQPERTMIRYQGADTSWGAFDRRSDELAAGLSALGIGVGDAVAVLMDNRVEYLEIIAATLKLGAIVVPLNQRWTSSELVHPLVDSDAAVLCTDDTFLERVVELRVKLDHLRVFTAGEQHVPGIEPIASLYVGDAEPVRTALGPDDPAFLCYTSGTTGFPKGAVLTHGSIRASGTAKVLCDGMTWRDRVLCHVPLAMTAGCVTLFMEMCLVPGATLVLERDFDPTRCLDLIENERIAMITGVPVFLEMMMADPTFADRDLSSLKWITTGGASVNLELLRAWQERGVDITQAYGLTEASGGCVFLNSADAVRKVGFAGLPMLHTHLRIVDPEGNDAPAGVVGEILVQGPSVMKEYRNRPDETAAALSGGWLHTGDLGLLDDEGYLKVVDRKKDMIISGGINVYPAEIERALAGVPGIGEFAVIGVPDERWGEVPLLVVADDLAIDVDALVSTCLSELADYKRPRYLVANGGPLPRNVSGKLVKPQLREKYATAPAAAVDLKAR